MQRHRCWRCGEERPPELRCGGCGAPLPPPDGASYFTLMGFPDHPALDVKELEARYLALSRELHPDRHHGDDARQHAASVRASALLNQAYRTLRDLEERGRYWLRRQGETLGRDNAQVPAGLAEMVFETQDLLSRLRCSEATERPALRAEISRVKDELATRILSGRKRLSEILERWPVASNGHSQTATPPARALKDVLSELSYLRTLEREVLAALET